ncbi:glycosyltransferase [Yoonia sp.]|uniref:glycosyltransferase family 2 protein n=1 Tax=Yoonia sp. TaxID=2212373 RepID=UPI0025F6E512|nr:glycosyltransferase [Yoonia sp.]
MANLKPKIAIGVITHRRLDMLSTLLDSILAMAPLPDADIIVVVVENDTVMTTQSLVEGHPLGEVFAVKLALQPELGIPFARNKVLDMALAEGCDFLAFVDDDEVVAQDWLQKLYAGIATRDLDLVGGPVLFDPPAGAELAFVQRSVLADVRTRAARNHAERAQSVGSAREGGFAIFTGNWMLRLATQRRLGTRFDESLRFSGGEDSAFHASFAAAGGRTGWVADAVATEIRPLSRLTLRYHFQRCRDLEMSRLSRRPKRKLDAFVMYFVGVMRATVYLLVSPFDKFRGLALAARNLGKATGRVQAAFGQQSQHYTPGTTS